MFEEKVCELILTRLYGVESGSKMFAILEALFLGLEKVIVAFRV